MERMPGGHYRTREGVIAQDAGSGGLIHSTGRAGVRGALGRTRGVRAQAPHQGDGAGAGKARKARTSHCQEKAHSPREGRCRGGARARAQSWPSLLRLDASSTRAPLRKTSVSGSEKVRGWESRKTLVSVTAYHSFGG